MKRLGSWTVLLSLAIGAAALIIAACAGPPPPTTFSPPAAAVSGSPWQAAEQLRKEVPNSMLMVGHGGGMLPLYPDGTVLVLQRLEWEHLRQGMTVIFFNEPGNRRSIGGEILVEQEGGHWRAVAANGGESASGFVDPGNYVGTVVAAFRSAGPADTAALLRSVPAGEAASCSMSCHLR
jgi:hypothetical protein